jgi:5-methylcytosine-specific restriction endonuclease McrA
VSSDYAAICTENIRRYGTETKHLTVLERLYSDRTHFLYELLQNAEDAGASAVVFDLTDLHLRVTHDGRPFSEADVRGVCGIGDSTKADNLTAIGKFGIGFKSVYAYTRRPQIHSGDEHFEIAHYVRPAPVRAVERPGPSTVILLPFDREDLPADQAAAQIREGLAALREEDLLFLRSISRIEVRHGGQLHETLTRDPATQPHVVSVTRARQGRVHRHPSWLLFSRPLPDRPELRVEIAFKRSTHGERAELEAIRDASLVAFFSLDRPSGLSFLVQAPFRTTPARDNVPDDAWNHDLISVAADLLVDTLHEMRDDGSLSARFLELLPLTPKRFPAGHLLAELYEAVRHALTDDPLLPAGRGQFVEAARARLNRGEALRSLLGPSEFSLFSDGPEEQVWLDPSISEARTPNLRAFLRNVAGVPELSMEWLAPRLTAARLTRVSDEWLCRLYGSLAESPALWRTADLGGRPGPVRRMPIVRCQDGKLRTPFDADDSPLVFLPSSAPTSFATIAPSLMKDPKSRAFFGALGLREPDLVAEVERHVLPRYRSNAVAVSDEQYADDVVLLRRALAAASGEARARLLEDLQELYIVRTGRADGEDPGFDRPRDAYCNDADLRHYALPDPTLRFIHPEAARSWGEAYASLGLLTFPQATVVRPGADGNVVLCDEKGDHRRGLNGFHPRLAIDGLRKALADPDRRRSAYVWNTVLLPQAHRLKGRVEEASTKSYARSRIYAKTTPARDWAVSTAWLPTSDGGWAKPRELRLDELPKEFRRSPDLAEALGMVSSPVIDAGRALGIPPKLAQRLASDPELIARIERELAEEEEAARAPEPFEDVPQPVDFAELLAEALSRPGKSALPVQVASSPIVPELTRRRQRVGQQIQEAQSRERGADQRFTMVPRKTWEGRDSTVRAQLREWYGGHCQVCGSTFADRQGRPYFEGLHLVSTTHAAWVDRVGNVMALCPTCCAKFLHGAVGAEDFLEQVERWCPGPQGAAGASFHLRLCGQPVAVIYHPKHLLDLQVLLELSSVAAGQPAAG